MSARSTKAISAIAWRYIFRNKLQLMQIWSGDSAKHVTWQKRENASVLTFHEKSKLSSSRVHYDSVACKWRNSNQLAKHALHIVQLALVLNFNSRRNQWPKRKFKHTKCFWTTIIVALMNKIQIGKNKHMNDHPHMLFKNTNWGKKKRGQNNKVKLILID